MSSRACSRDKMGAVVRGAGKASVQLPGACAGSAMSMCTLPAENVKVT